MSRPDVEDFLPKPEFEKFPGDLSMSHKGGSLRRCDVLRSALRLTRNTSEVEGLALSEVEGRSTRGVEG